MTGEELTAWMAEHHYDPRWLAYDLGVHWTLIHKLETGEVAITPVMCLALHRLAADKRRGDIRRGVQWSGSDVRDWMGQHQFSEEDLGIALDMSDRAISTLLASERVPRNIVWALRGLQTRLIAGPAGESMSPGEFRAYLEEQKLTPGEVAEGLGVTRGAITRWQNGTRPVTPPTALALATLSRRRR